MVRCYGEMVREEGMGRLLGDLMTHMQIYGPVKMIKTALSNFLIYLPAFCIAKK